MSSRREQYEEFFNGADTDGTGSLTIDEVTQLMVSRGHSSAEAAQFINQFDASGDGSVSKEEFLNAMDGTRDAECRQAEQMRVCKQFDHNGDGTISRAELKQEMQKGRADFSEEDAKRLLELCDADGDDIITLEELRLKCFGGQ